MKIAYIVESLHNSAGMERVLILKANALCTRWSITFITRNQQELPISFELDPRVNVVNASAIDKKDYKKKLNSILLREKFDICISTGGLEFYFLYKIHDGSIKVFESHFSFYISKVWMSRITNPILRWMAIQIQTARRIFFARKYSHIVVLCESDLKLWKRYINRVSYIYNPITIKTSLLVSNCQTCQAIAVGRLDYQKGFDLLIDVWNEVHQRHSNWVLKIYGEGILRDQLQNKIDELGLSSVIKLEGRTDDISSKYLESSIFISSSRDEAFGLVITEAESCGLPIISFDCPSAPRELINNNVNGFLVPLGNCHMMARSINYLIENKEIRKSMGEKSHEMSKLYSVDVIIQKWILLFEKLYNEQA